MKFFLKQQRYLIIGLLLLSVTGSAQQWGNYTLYSLQNATAAYLMDTNQAVVKTWTFTSAQKTGYSSYLMPGGTLWRTVSRSGNSFSGGPICGEVQKVAWDGTVQWDFVYSTTDYCTHHDICPMPNGNVLLISYERKTAAQATQAGSTTSIEIWPDKIVEVKPTGATTGEVVWEWHAWDHLVQSKDATKDNYQTSVLQHPELLDINYKTSKDWMHMNGVDYNPVLDQVIFSSHNLNEWYIIDHSTTTAEAASHKGGNSGKGGDFLYRWGNPAGYGATGTTILNVTHDAHWIPEGVPNAGYVVGFNNKGVSASQSSVDQILPPLNGYNYDYTAGAAFTPASYLLRHACTGYSSNMGNSQQLPNGNMLVCVATAGKVYELNASGTVLWSKTFAGSVPQAFKYDTCYVQNAAPAIPVITNNNNILTSSSAATYQWYKNGKQIQTATAQNYTPTDSGVYLVRVTDGVGCSYSYSTGYRFGVTTTTGISSQENELANLGMYPNPTTGILTIDGLQGLEYETIVYSLSGKTLLQRSNAGTLDLSGYDAGIYYVTIRTASGMSINKKVSLIK